jgi:hypothetical protein
MTRTTKGHKAPGYEFGSGRGGKKGWCGPGTFAKKVTHRLERKINKRATKEDDHARDIP